MESSDITVVQDDVQVTQNDSADRSGESFSGVRPTMEEKADSTNSPSAVGPVLPEANIDMAESTSSGCLGEGKLHKASSYSFLLISQRFSSGDGNAPSNVIESELKMDDGPKPDFDADAKPAQINDDAKPENKLNGERTDGVKIDPVKPEVAAVILASSPDVDKKDQIARILTNLSSDRLSGLLSMIESGSKLPTEFLLVDFTNAYLFLTRFTGGAKCG
jgi:hypothetical protein